MHEGLALVFAQWLPPISTCGVTTAKPNQVLKQTELPGHHFTVYGTVKKDVVIYQSFQY